MQNLGGFRRKVMGISQSTVEAINQRKLILKGVMGISQSTVEAIDQRKLILQAEQYPKMQGIKQETKITITIDKTDNKEEKERALAGQERKRR